MARSSRGSQRARQGSTARSAVAAAVFSDQARTALLDLADSEWQRYIAQEKSRVNGQLPGTALADTDSDCCARTGGTGLGPAMAFLIARASGDPPDPP